ncbi:hypothetical protein PoB_006072400 [Plakobranchus ocellatus]|uniref:Uncharacterized protein n=1 Tax=Plakobranchus ocellatus TaxID=259542 RepID=A0AAV4CQP3_9GAST|nr:hypothetical protein PoB_006072400 [Plakobranchus ocellatus]
MSLKYGNESLVNGNVVLRSPSVIEFYRGSPERTEASPQQGDLRLSGPPSGQGAGSGARTRDRRVPADLRADSQATVLPTPPYRDNDDDVDDNDDFELFLTVSSM